MTSPSLDCAVAPQDVATPPYQGSLVNGNWTPIADGNYRMRFTLYDAALGGTNRWQETDASVPVTSESLASKHDWPRLNRF